MAFLRKKITFFKNLITFKSVVRLLQFFKKIRINYVFVLLNI